MKETSTQSNYTDRIRSWARTHGGTHRSARPSEPHLLPVSNPHPDTESAATPGSSNHATALHSTAVVRDSAPVDYTAADKKAEAEAIRVAGNSNRDGGVIPSPDASPQASGPGSVLDGGNEKEEGKKSIVTRFLLTAKTILFCSKLNLLLVFVPIGIVVEVIPNMPPGVIFGMNALAIIPLAGLLSFATEAVARRLGDSLGALLNVTFGNAVELIILYVLAAALWSYDPS